MNTKFTEESGTTALGLHFHQAGEGHPVILLHGYPLSGDSWRSQAAALIEEGYRVITPDRRGFGQSNHKVDGFNYDTFAEDLHGLISYLDLDKFALVGFSMGSGEVARYATTYGTDSMTHAALLGALGPHLLRGPENPDGVDPATRDEIIEKATNDREAWFKEFFQDFYNLDENLGTKITEEQLAADMETALGSAEEAAAGVVPSWFEDFRTGISKLRISGTPTLIMHGTADQILPINASARALHRAFPESNYIEIEGAPHGFLSTHAEEVNRALIEHLGHSGT